MRHKDRVSSLAFSPDGELLATGSLGIAIVWDLSNEMKLVEVYPPAMVPSVSFSPDGKYLATGNYELTAVIWNILSGEKIIGFRSPGSVLSVSFSPDGMYLATGSHKIAVVHEIPGRRKIAEFSYSDWVSVVVFSPDGRYLATGSWDESSSVWDLSSGGELAEFRIPGWVNSVSFSPDGENYSITGGMTFQIAKWKKKSILITERYTNMVRGGSWFKRFPVWIVEGREKGLSAPFAKICGRLRAVGISGRGFLALGYNNGTIEIIREGKGI